MVNEIIQSLSKPPFLTISDGSLGYFFPLIENLWLLYLEQIGQVLLVVKNTVSHLNSLALFNCSLILAKLDIRLSANSGCFMQILLNSISAVS